MVLQQRLYNHRGTKKTWARNATSDSHAGSACPGRNLRKWVAASTRCSTNAGVSQIRTYTPTPKQHIRRVPPILTANDPRDTKVTNPRGAPAIRPCWDATIPLGRMASLSAAKPRSMHCTHQVCVGGSVAVSMGCYVLWCVWCCVCGGGRLVCVCVFLGCRQNGLE